MDSTALLLWGVVFSSIGLGFFLYGRKQKKTVFFLCGLLLMIYPYFVTNSYLLFLLGVAIIAIPYYWQG